MIIKSMTLESTYEKNEPTIAKGANKGIDP